MSDAEFKEFVRSTLKDLVKEVKDLKKEYKCLIEVQQKLIHERLGVPVPTQPITYGETKKNPKIINITRDSNELVITGNTFNHRSLIKDIAKGKAQWNNDLKGWNIPGEYEDDLIKEFKKMSVEYSIDGVEATTKESGSTTDDSIQIEKVDEDPKSPVKKEKTKKSSKSKKKSSKDSDSEEGFGVL
jgi:hypothetical protein